MCAVQVAPVPGTLTYIGLGLGAGRASLVLTGPLFRQFNEIYDKNCMRMSLLQPDHFKSPSYAPAIHVVCPIFAGPLCCTRISASN